ncbi:glycerol-3-phosphate dehydrogenase/oxidase [Natronosporangium hydrolyticum]|uniref:Glycerol-3-phosphate dehydrogenase n=1 Tax=Natronosporangium hydrolyticum TaxID=2811111 RepID=A0A895YBD2_9ACTN|nr:glycerol-3-phosphate dehydrogenase/oxidase [Natronosporangium hydrolyticum]QSB15104.1 glycerol-3-phosphate dehydrogenase/oxidase [Natronosporangium hydrolyticum]
MRDPETSRFAAGRLSPARRKTDLDRLRSETFDVLVIGGGVTGAGAAVDAAARGLSVALVEARDLAAGTSSRSTKLIHGGLRYLEQAEFPLVHEALAERELLAGRLAPHLVRPVPILLPLPAKAWPVRAGLRAYYGAGVALYDAFAGLVGQGRVVPKHRHLSRAATRRLFPSLRPDATGGAIRFYDGQVDDARLVVTLARTAASLGAAVVTSTRVTDLRDDGEQITGARVRELESGEEIDVRARVVVAATGVWSDDLTKMLPRARPGLRVRASKGVHLMVSRSAISGEVGLLLRTPSSVLFALPWGGHWLIGTTDTDWELDRAHPAASAHDIGYLLNQLNQVLDRPLTEADIEGVYAGLRPLLAGEDEATSALSREHAVVAPMPGLLLVAGGKLTTYRVMAADVVDIAAQQLGVARRSSTARLPLLGADGYAAMWWDRAALAARFGVPVGVVEHLLERYGTLTPEVLAIAAADKELAAPLTGAPEYLAAEIVYAARTEAVVHLEDALTRRTRISIETPHRGEATARHAAQLLGAELGWSEAQVEREIAHYLTRVAAERESQRMPDDQTADAARLGAPDLRGPDQPVGEG